MTKKFIALRTKNIEYTLRETKKSRRMKISVSSDKGLVVSVPPFLSLTLIEHFLHEKAEWIIQKLDLIKNIGPLPKKYSKKEINQFKKQARMLVEERLRYFNTLYHFSWNRISIRNQKTRWGSCSKNHNLNFNYKITLLPPYLADYIIVHELCHLGELNHSKKFWALVARACSNYPVMKKELHKHGLRFY